MQELKEKLIKEHEEIDANEDKDTDLEGRHYRTDKDCLTAGKILDNVFLSFQNKPRNKMLQNNNKMKQDLTSQS